MAIAARGQTRSEGRATTSRRSRSGMRTLVMVVGLGIFAIWTLMPFF